MKTLKELIKSNPIKIEGSDDIPIEGITYNSNKVKNNYIFVCLKGKKTHGKFFIKEAIENGAKVIVSEEEIKINKNVTFIQVHDALSTLAEFSKTLYDNPSSNLLLIGVTGTNGKTTTSYLIESIFKTAGHATSRIGTINYQIGDETIEPDTTTPQSSDIQYLLHKSIENNIKVAVMEVSSHGIALRRLEGVEFDIAIFTNLSKEHLDFHNTIEEYFSVKSKLFTEILENSPKKNKFAIINIDNSWGKELLKFVKTKTLTYGLSSEADIQAKHLKTSLNGLEFVLSKNEPRPCLQERGEVEVPINLNLIGAHNVYNALAAAACAISQNISLDIIKAGLENVKFIPGRLENVNCGQDFLVLVDYAHTPDALENVLSTLKELKSRIITVFGCGGDRDRTKRPVMGEIACNLSDFVVITTDNPRTEDPQKILLDIEIGARKTERNNYIIIEDRKEAIRYAISIVKCNDILLVAGKGHENYQIIGNEKILFKDADVIKEILKSGKNIY